MDFRILGPIEVGNGNAAVPLGPRKQRLTLAVLLCNPGAPVSGDQLIDALWPGKPPRTALANVYVNVSQLRALLGADRVRGRAQPGYLLHIAADELDRHRFEQAAVDARASADRGDLVKAGMLLRDALALWRGPIPFGDLATELALQSEVNRLEQLRLATLELRVDVDLGLGLHANLMGELPDLVAAHPFREHLQAQLMLTLYRCGRRAEALDAYRAAARALAEEFGIQPGPRLRDLHRAILRDDPALGSLDHTNFATGAAVTVPASPDPAPTGAGPRFLPPGIGDFCGRDRDLARLEELSAASPDAVTVAIVSGMAGVGKSTLAIHFADRHAARFPGGRLHVDLRGYASPAPMSVIDALAVLLRGLGVTAHIPPDVDQATAVYRAAVHHRRVLVILDNARTADQVRALVPTGPGSMALVTSRDHLDGLAATHAARRVHLDTLDADDSLDLLRRIVGTERVEAEPAASRELADLCGHLPLAIRIAAAQLADRAERRIATHVAEVRTQGPARLHVEGEPALGVSAILDQSYAVLADDRRQMLRLLGLLPLPDHTATSVAALAGVPPEQAGRLLDQLAAVSLVQRQSGGRYRLHDLVREYAAGLAREVDHPAEVSAATSRVLQHFLELSDAATRLMFPQMLRLPAAAPPTDNPFTAPAEAAAWLDAERANLVACVCLAATAGPYEMAARIADALRGHFALGTHLPAGLAVARAAIQAGRTCDDHTAQASGWLARAGLYRRQGDLRQAVRGFRVAIAHSERCGWWPGQAAALANLGSLYAEAGQLGRAVTCLTHARELHRSRPDAAAHAHLLGNIVANLGFVFMQQGQLARAADTARETLAIARTIKAHGTESVALNNLGVAYHALGDFDRALENLGASLAAYRAVGDRSGQVEATRGMALVHRDRDELTEALRLAEDALLMARAIGHHAFEIRSQVALASVHARRGDADKALDQFTQALARARATDNHYLQCQALIGLAGCVRPHRQALDHGWQARRLASAGGYAHLEGQALTTLATVYLDDGQPERAIRTATLAAGIHRRTGHRPGLERSERIVIDARQNLG